MLKARLQDDVKQCMKAQEKSKLGILRLIMAALKQEEVDKRIELDDQAVIAILTKMLKQRKESITQFEAAGRTELSAQEEYEIGIISAYMPEQMSAEDIQKHVSAAIAETKAETARDMGKVMAILRDQLQGRADMTEVSKLVKEALG
jgi:uncharacterized protein YqeY